MTFPENLNPDPVSGRASMRRLGFALKQPLKSCQAPGAAVRLQRTEGKSVSNNEATPSSAGGVRSLYRLVNGMFTVQSPCAVHVTSASRTPQQTGKNRQ